MIYPIQDGPKVKLIHGACRGLIGRITKHYLPDNPKAIQQEPAWWVVVQGFDSVAGGPVLSEDYDERHGLWYTQSQFKIVFE